ncbi:hypothetical protein BW730_15480 [Tessaracoccus aquimaris]|uniref:BD-FAE-like domain-containing protein n=1 Tax=Tessaracoccus aquimaris TaxID=1332264 RepID=A0A1Q2CRH0_9ACTN|nr:alpha/beta hydrolase [Tessaracoccus aquimaris]AQP48697.1 hypothetical protein BW730_15480 [Tessaracoccus aquimaris]
MRNFTVEFNPERNVTLEATVFDLPSPDEQPTSLESPRPAVIICPGGGYEFLSQREADPVAAGFLAKGFDTFVLRYSIREHAIGLNPLIDAARAVRWVRLHAADLGVDPTRIAFLGFSAGGHVSGMIGTRWDEPSLHEAERAEYEALTARGLDANVGLLDVSPRPDAIVPCYAVFNFDWVDDRTDEISFSDSIAAVTDQTPPTFLWTTNEDNVVPPTQSLRFATALSDAGVPFEYHHFARGEHGLSTATPVANADRVSLPENAHAWLDLCASWLRATWGR